MDILETSSMRVIDSVAYGHYVLGVIRYHTEDEDYFLKSLAEAGLQYELLWQSGYVALMRHDHPLAQKEQLSAGDFDPYVEIAFGDEEVPYIRVSESETHSCFLRSVHVGLAAAGGNSPEQPTDPAEMSSELPVQGSDHQQSRIPVQPVGPGFHRQIVSTAK